MVRTQSPEKRRSIVDAATQAFSEDGYEATNMDRIAERAGASKRTVYNYFPSKEALFLAVIEELLEKKRAAKRVAWDPARSLEDQLAEMARSKSVLVDEPSELALMRVVIGVFITHPDLARVALQSGDDPLVPWLEAAHAAKRLVVPDVEMAARLFWGLAAGTLFWPALFDGPESVEREETVRELVTLFLACYRP